MLQALRESGERLTKLAAELSSRTAGDRSQDDLEVSLANELVDLGIINPVTKSSAGKQYHEQLSRELAFFLQEHLSKEKGMMVLHDVFCLFNRWPPQPESCECAARWLPSARVCALSFGAPA